MKQLIAAGSDLVLKNQDNLTALQVAKQQKYTNVVDYLLEKEHAISLLCKGPVRTLPVSGNSNGMVTNKAPELRGG